MGVVCRRWGIYSHHDNQQLEAMQVKQPSPQCHGHASPHCISFRRSDKVHIWCYLKVIKFLDAREFCCNLPLIQTKRPNLRVLCQKDANGIANSEDPDPLGAV